MLTVVLGTVTAALFGSADFLGGLASRKRPALLVSGMMFATGVVLFSVLLLVVRPVAVGRADIGLGVLSGVFGTVGVFALYEALAVGRMSVVAPLTAALSGAGPAAWDLAHGSHVSVPGLIGLTLALVAVVVVSTTTGTVDEHGMPPKAVALSVLAGSMFACSLVALSLTSHASGFAALLVARVVGTALFGVALLVRRRDVFSAGVPLTDAGVRMAVLAGVLDATANVTILSAIRIGPLAVAAVVGGLYPVATMLLARAVLAERLKRHQVLGVALALVAVVLTALP
jgi:drug/metabolite transporter (DMT)-like permease